MITVRFHKLFSNLITTQAQTQIIIRMDKTIPWLLYLLKNQIVYHFRTRKY